MTDKHGSCDSILKETEEKNPYLVYLVDESNQDYVTVYFSRCVIRKISI